MARATSTALLAGCLLARSSFAAAARSRGSFAAGPAHRPPPRLKQPIPVAMSEGFGPTPSLVRAPLVGFSF